MAQSIPSGPNSYLSSLDYCPSVDQPHGILIMQMPYLEYKTKVFHDEMQKKKPLFWNSLCP